MAVTTTVRQLIEAAYAKSTKNKANTIASESGELLQLVIRTLRSLYAGGARVNPYFFSESANVAFASPGWARPEGAQLIYRIEAASVSPPASITAGTEIAVVPFESKNIEPGKPALFRFGQIFRPVSTSATVAPISPQNGSLTFYYSRRPSTPASLDTAIDSLWIEDFNEIIILRIARYLALKDGRTDEAGLLATELTEWAEQFVAFLEHETANEIRSYGHIGRFNAPSLVPVMSLLTGMKTA